MRGPIAPSRGHRLGLALLVGGAGLVAAAVLLWWLHASIGPATRRVNVRWRPDVEAARRGEAERALGLERGIGAGGQTWTYTLRNRSAPGVAAILGSPLIEDTHHLDPVRQRIVLDPPDPANIHHRAERVLLLLPWLLTPLEADQLPRTSVTLAIVGTLLLAAAHRALFWLLRWLWTIAVAAGRIPPSAARAIARGGEWTRDAIDGRVGYARGTSAGPSPAEYLFAVALSLFFLAPLLWYGPYEEEVVQHSIFPNQLFYRALFRGEWLYWVNDLGFGGPLPGDRLLFHPVAGPLLAWSSIRVALSALWIAHGAVMAIAFLRVTALSGIRSSFLRLFLLACYLWSSVDMVYFYDTDWVTNAIAWGLYPVLVYGLYAGVRGQAAGRLVTAIGLALLFAFWILNAHPGYVAPLVAVLVVYTVAAAPRRRDVYAGLGLAALLCVAVTSAHLYALAHEARLFDASTVFDRGGVALATYVLAALTFDLTDRRLPMLGLALLVAALATVATPSTWRHPHLRACAAAFVAAIGLGLLPQALLRIVAPSGASLFRDPFIFFGLLLGGALLQRLVDRRRTGVVAVLLLCQAWQQTVTVVRPSLGDFAGGRNKLQFYRYQDQTVGLGRELVDASRRFGRRLYLSPQADAAMRGNLSPAGVHFSSDLVLIGLNPVNGWFKNVAMGVIYPPESMMESLIDGDLNVIRNGPLLDVLGLGLVLTTEAEGPLPAGLEIVSQGPVRQARPMIEGDLIIAANPDAWPKAVLLDTAAAAVTVPVRAGCAHTAALCRNYEPLVSHRLAAPVSLRERNGEFTATFPPAGAARLLFISGLYRPEWEAAASTGARLDVRPVAHAFLGVTVPPGVGGVTVVYRPRLLQALTWFSSLTFAALCVAWVTLRWRRRGRAAS